MTYHLHLVLSCALLFLSACGGKSNSENSVELDLYVDHYKAECVGVAVWLCLRTRDTTDMDWTLFYGCIEGFSYEWGYNYKLKIRVTDIENPPADASSKKYTLLKIESKEVEPTTTTFDVAASLAPGSITNISDGIYQIYGDKQFSCELSQCDTLESLITQDQAILLEFSHSFSTQDPMEVTQLKCSSPPKSFMIPVYDNCSMS